MKQQVDMGKFDPARLLTDVLSRLVKAHSVEHATSRSGSDDISAERTQLPRSPTRAAGEILKAAERRWPSRYY
jgi:hypothetical protein